MFRKRQQLHDRGFRGFATLSANYQHNLDHLECQYRRANNSRRSSSRRPTVRIESDLGEFVDLRDKVYNSMFEAHYKGYCKFCLRVLGVVVEGVDPGGVFFTLFGQDRVVRKLTKFMEDLLARTVGHASANTQGCCSAQILVPQIVHAFLFTPQPPTASEAA